MNIDKILKCKNQKCKKFQFISLCINVLLIFFRIFVFNVVIYKLFSNIRLYTEIYTNNYTFIPIIRYT